MKNEIYSLWYKHPSQLINTPQMSLMVRKEGIESYGLYMHLADTLHLVGGFQEYDFNDICLMLGYTKKNIKAKLGRVINDYKLFDFYTNDDGIEMIGLERLKEDIEALSKHKINGAKGGKKRAENYRNKQEEEVEEVKLAESYLNKSRYDQIKFVDFIKRKGELPEYKIKAYENAIKPRLSI
ncbi:hypothetical protein N9839_03065 [Flavobacteriaceae bacterium]|jgi:uncharacterized protein YdaU (DUF1376 family)|nr:hypothetical protein [Flavobacteriaceae bacterium]